MKTSSLTFPPDINLLSPDYKKMRKWLQFRYSNFSEWTVMSHTIRNSSQVSSWYNSSTCRKKTVQLRMKELIEKCCVSLIASDYYPVLPESVYLHLMSRIAAYKVAGMCCQHHPCLSGSESRKLSGHFFLVGTTGEASIKRQLLYDLWQKYRSDTVWVRSLRSVGEHWKYGRIFVRIGTRNVRFELWFDLRPWREMAGLEDRFYAELSRFA